MRRPPTDAETVLATRVSRYLLDTERLVVAVRRHPAQLVEPVGSALAALLVALWVDPRIPAGLPVVVDVVWVAWLVVAARATWRLLQWRFDWFVATDRRLLLTYGVFTRKVAMMPLSKVTDLSYNRTPTGRLLGYGEFVLESAGQDQALRSIDWLPRPDSLYRLICAEIFDPDVGRYRPRDRPRRRTPQPQDSRQHDTDRVEGWPGPVE